MPFVLITAATETALSAFAGNLGQATTNMTSTEVSSIDVFITMRPETQTMLNLGF
jgi:hypothetical protein